MSQQPLDYASPVRTSAQVRTAWVVTTSFTLVWVITNFVLFVVSRSVSDGFKGMAIEVFGAIALNALLMIVAIGLSVWISRTAGSTILAVFLGTAVLFPTAALGGALWIIYG